MILYTKEMLNNFNFPFVGIENIGNNFSQSFQDMFCLSVLNGKRNGTFLEVGAFHASYLSNTFLLERDYGWKGISIDLDPNVEPQFQGAGRTAKFITGDATKLDYDKILGDFGVQDLDYLQIDCEPNINSLNCLKRIPFDKFDFKVISFEHDHYSPENSKEYNDAIRKESEEILESYGYIAVAKNIENMGNDEFESWWISPKYISMETIDKFMLDDVNKPVRAKDYMLRNR